MLRYFRNDAKLQSTIKRMVCFAPVLDRERVYEKLKLKIAGQASGGQLVADAVERAFSAVASWCDTKGIDDRRVRWLLGNQTWRGALFSENAAPTVDTVMAVVHQVLAYQEPSRVWQRPAAENVLVAGEGAGRLIFVETEEELARGDIPPDAIIVSPEIWRTPYPVVAGLILTSRVEIEGAHHLGWFGGMRSPIVCLPGIESDLRKLAKSKTICRIGATGSDVRLHTEVPEDEATTIERDKRPPVSLEVSNPPLHLITTESTWATDVGAVGHKACGLHGVDSAPAFTRIPSSFEQLFLERAGVADRDDTAVGPAIRALRFEDVEANVRTLFDALVQALPASNEVLRLRTSSNYEDLIGAGVAESTTIVCRTPRDLFEGMCEVYAEQFSPRACLLRRMFNITPKQRRMAIMAHLDLKADWNGTARVEPVGNNWQVHVFGMRGDRQVTARGSEERLDLCVRLLVGDEGVKFDNEASLSRGQKKLVHGVGLALVRAVQAKGHLPTQLEWIAKSPWHRLKAPEVTILQADTQMARNVSGEQADTVSDGSRIETFLATHKEVMGLSRWLERSLSTSIVNTKFVLMALGERRFLALGDQRTVDHYTIANSVRRGFHEARTLLFGEIGAEISIDARGFYADDICFYGAPGIGAERDTLRGDDEIERALESALLGMEAVEGFRPCSATFEPKIATKAWYPALPSSTDETEVAACSLETSGAISVR